MRHNKYTTGQERGFGEYKGMKRYRYIVLTCLAIMCFFLAACGGKQMAETNIEQKAVTHFKGIYIGNPPKEGLEEFYEQLDSLTIPELACTFRFEFIPWGNEREQLNLATASGEYDFLPGGVFSDYRKLIAKNAFLNLNEYLSITPSLVQHYKTYSENALLDCEINGALYGLPQFSAGEIENINEGFFYREDLRKEWGLKEITDLDTLEAYLYRAKEDPRYKDSPLITDNRAWQSLWFLVTKGKYLEIVSIQESPLVVVDAKKPDEVINRLTLPEFYEVLTYLKKWKNDGILDSDLLSVSNNEGDRAKSMLIRDEKPCETNVPIWSINSSYISNLCENNKECNYSFFPYLSVYDKWYMGSLEEASVISISSKTTRPDIAILLLEKIHTDERYYRLFKYGVEGIHYNLIDGKVSREDIPTNNHFGWTVASDEMLTLEEVPVNEAWQNNVVKKVDEWRDKVVQESEDSPLNGFHFQTVNVNTQISQMDYVMQQYFLPLICGYSDNIKNDIKVMNDKLEQAGFNEYLNELQSQLENR